MKSIVLHTFSDHLKCKCKFLLYSIFSMYYSHNTCISSESITAR